MSFPLCIDSLNKLLAKAKELGVLKPIAPWEVVTYVSLYADDMVIFCHPDEAELHMVRAILALFDNASRLRTHFAKCLVSLIACSDEEALEVAEVMECQLAPFSIKYLEIPLTVGRCRHQRSNHWLTA
jgi:hypothetical protein